MTKLEAEQTAKTFNSNADHRRKAQYLLNRYGSRMTSTGRELLYEAANGEALSHYVVAELDKIGVTL